MFRGNYFKSFDCIQYDNFLIYFNWRLITLQHCGGFVIHTHESATNVHVFPHPEPPLLTPSPPHPSGLSQSTSFECPASCIELALVIYFTYGNIHVLMLFSHIVPPSSRQCYEFFEISIAEECLNFVLFFSLPGFFRALSLTH